MNNNKGKTEGNRSSTREPWDHRDLAYTLSLVLYECMNSRPLISLASLQGIKNNNNNA